MITSAELQGVFPPVLLPMTEAGEVDTASLGRLVDHLLGGGVHGLWVNGTTGEFYGLDAEARTQAVREFVQAVDGRVPVVAHVGDTSTALAVRHARAAIAAGAQHLSVLAPYLVGFTQAELKDHVRAVAEAAGRPVLAYNLPQFAPVGLSIDSIVELAAEGVLCGAKDSSSDVVWFRQLARRLREAGLPIALLTGGSSVADVGYMLGAVGSVSSLANVAPRHLVRQYVAAERKDWAQVVSLQEQSEELIDQLRPTGVPVTPGLTMAAFKYVLADMGVIATERSAAPQAPLSAEARQHLAERALPLLRRLEHDAPVGV
jgi:4-hydroxy-tetrahydrodipicolinate synthase